MSTNDSNPVEQTNTIIITPPQSVTKNIALSSAITNSNSRHVKSMIYSVMYIFLAVILVSVMKKNFDFLFNILNKNDILIKNKKRSESIKTLLKNISTFIIYIFLVGILLNVWEIDVKPLLAGLGIVGLSLGIGAQTYLRNIISGVMLLIDEYYHIGDVIEISGITGRVKEVNLQTTILENEKNEIVVIPNGQISIVRILTETDVSK